MLPASLLILGGCASHPVDYSALESKVGQAKSGDFGTCYTNIHSAASALEEAEANLARIKAFPDFTSKSTVDAAIAKVNMALADKAAADEACNARTAVLEKDMVDVKKTLANHEMRLKELEKVREIVRGVTFQTGSAKLTREAQVVLDVVANRLQRSPIPVQIAGHASSTGTPEMNMKLSQARAESVMRFLVSRGVDPKLLTAKGYGITQPIATNETADGRRANQRVELRFRE
jgi:outer membrane protein OmpA-like peptidoglycan-associated protein